MEEQPKCIKCGGEVKGFKCDVCGYESELHEPDHEHQGHHVSKCVGCGEAETNCTCEKQG